MDLDGLSAQIRSLEKRKMERFEEMDRRFAAADKKQDALTQEVKGLRADMLEHPNGAIPKLSDKVGSNFWKLVIGLCLVVLADVGIHTPIIQALLKYL